MNRVSALTIEDMNNFIPHTKDMDRIKPGNSQNIEWYYLNPSDLFSDKPLRRLTVSNRMGECNLGKSILEKLNVSGLEMTRTEKALYKKYFNKL